MNFNGIYNKIMAFGNYINESYDLLIEFYQKNNHFLIRGFTIIVILGITPYLINILDFNLGIIGRILETIYNLLNILWKKIKKLLGIKPKEKLVYLQNVEGVKFWFIVNADQSLTAINEKISDELLLK